MLTFPLHSEQLANRRQTKGLIYKTVRRIHTKSVRADSSSKRHAPQNILIYNNLRMPASVPFPFINPKSTWNCPHMDQPHNPLSTSPHLTTNDQCKAPHACLSPADQWVFTVTHGND